MIHASGPVVEGQCIRTSEAHAADEGSRNIPRPLLLRRPGETQRGDSGLLSRPVAGLPQSPARGRKMGELDRTGQNIRSQVGQPEKHA